MEDMNDKFAYRVIKAQGSLEIKDKNTVYYRHILSDYINGSLILCRDPYDVTNVSLLPLIMAPLECLKPIKTVNHIPLKEILVGDKVISAIGNPGIITEIDYSEQGRYLGNMVITWEHGGKSHMPYRLSDAVWMYSVEYIGR